MYLSSPLLSVLPYSNSLYLSIFLRLDAIELLRKYISSDSRNGGKRGDTAALPPRLDAIFTCGGGEEITVKAREFAFVEISRIPADTTPLFPSAPRPYLPFPSLPPFFRFQTQFVCLRDRISSLDLKCLSKTRKCLSYVFPRLMRACSVFAKFSNSF